MRHRGEENVNKNDKVKVMRKWLLLNWIRVFFKDREEKS